MRRLTLWLACVLSLLAGSASAHDASSYGGVFRSRDLGAAWLNADVGLFLNAALVIAVDPRDSSHLLVGTDLGILSSHNGGRSWVPEARDVIIGAVFALAFSPDGELALCAAASGVFRRDQDGWLRAEAPESAIPARALIAGPANDRFYLLGQSGLFASKDGGRTYAVVPGLPQMSEMTALGGDPRIGRHSGGRDRRPGDDQPRWGAHLAQRRFRRRRCAGRHDRDRCDAAATRLGGGGRPDHGQRRSRL